MGTFEYQTSRGDKRSKIAVDPLLTVRESAALVNISVPSLRRRVADGTLRRPVKQGGLWRWPQSEILAVIEAAKARRGD